MNLQNQDVLTEACLNDFIKNITYCMYIWICCVYVQVRTYITSRNCFLTIVYSTNLKLSNFVIHVARHSSAVKRYERCGALMSSHRHRNSFAAVKRYCERHWYAKLREIQPANTACRYLCMCRCVYVQILRTIHGNTLRTSDVFLNARSKRNLAPIFLVLVFSN